MILTHFTKFNKVPNIVTAVTDGIFIPGKYAVTEKLDGANTSVHRTEFGFILCSRNNIVAVYNEKDPTQNEVASPFNGFVKYMFENASGLLRLPEGAKMYGEWLVQHTVVYPPEMYGHFYAFDRNLAEIAGTYAVFTLGVFDFSDVDVNSRESLDQFLKDVGQIPLDYAEKIGRKIEGVIIAPVNAGTNGDRFKVYAPDFKEDHKKAWSPKKAIEELELATAGYYPIRAYEKVIEKIEDTLGRKIRIEDTPQVIGRCSHDFFQEYFPIAIKAMKYPTLNTRKVKQAVEQRVRDIFITTMNTGFMPIYAQHQKRQEELKE